MTLLILKNTSDKASVDPFRYSFFRNWKDRWNGFLFAIQRRDELYDPIAAYRDKLHLALRTKLVDFEALFSQEQANLKQMEDRRLNLVKRLKVQWGNEIDAEDKALKDLEERTKDLVEGKGDLEQVRKSLLKSQEEYDLWKQAVGRLPYSERFSALANDSKIKKAAESGAKLELDVTQTSGRIRRVSRYLTGLFTYVLSLFAGLGIFTFGSVPVEITFTVPSFDAIVGDTWLSAASAAILFTASLIVLGEAVGAFCSKIWSHRVTINQDKKPEIVPKFEWTNAVFVACLIVFAFYAAAEGASLRAILPTLSECRKLEDADKVNHDRILSGKRVGDENKIGSPSPPFEEQVELRPDCNVRHILGNTLGFYNTIDGHLGFIIYCVLIFSAALRRRLSEDPIREYELVATDYAQQLGLWALAVLSFRRGVLQSKNKLTELKNWLGHVEEGNWNSVPDLQVLSIAIDKKISDIKQMKLAQTRWEKDSALYYRDHLRRFAWWFTRFRFGMNAKLRQRFLDYFHADNTQSHIPRVAE